MSATSKHYLIAIVLGLLATLALPPFHLVPVLLISFPGLLLLLERCGTKKHSFWLGWWFGFAHHVAGLYWICNSLLVDAAHFAWLIPFCISLIPAYLALYTGAVCWLVYCHPERRAKPAVEGSPDGVRSLGYARDDRFLSWQRVALFAVLWTAGEMLRSFLFTGFPWNLIGYVWTNSLRMGSLAAYGGVYGLSLLTVLACAMPVLCIPKTTRRRGVVLSLAIFSLCGLLSFCSLTLSLSKALDALDDTAPVSFTVRIVQPNIRQQMKWDERYAMDALMEHLRLTRLPYGKSPPQVVIWPESAISFNLNEDEGLRKVIADALPPGAVLILGSVRVERGPGKPRVYNSLQVMDKNARIIATYDKHHLVPFGEYVPLRWLWPFIEKITQGGMDFSHGPGPRTLEVAGLPPFSPLICYEAIFSGQVKDGAHPPAWLVNITNDAWFGDSTGPYQHLAMAKMRSVEEGIPLVRAANTGVSYANGKTLPLNQPGILDEAVYYRTDGGPRTPYSRYGILIPLACMVFLSAIAWFGRGNNL